ncbi:MAG: T9SS type A sorting domain-containing protein, partial [Candidatus Stahlbacteria bacterium]|nr:T9SS type A sorting domain-containing protein [Candidatus Stahlbacteria bacterium]
FNEEDSTDTLGNWELDSTVVYSGVASLHLTPDCPQGETYFVSQCLDAPTFDLGGKTITFSAKIRLQNPGGGLALLFAYNPESTDSLFGAIPVVGYTLLVPGAGDTGWVELSDSFVATGPAEIISAVLLVNGEGGGGWFDDVQVIFDVAEAGTGHDTSEVDDPLEGLQRNFYIGTVAEVARNWSEPAYEDLPSKIAEVSDIVNVFTHIKWNGLAGMPLLNGHKSQLQVSSQAKFLGLARMLTLDFTHDHIETVGEINSMPDGTPVDSLSPQVRQAYIDELVALVDEVDPVIVSVGIETSIFYTVRPDQWNNYVLLLQEVNDALSDRPEIHITAYFVLEQMISPDGTFDTTICNAWEQILPYCNSIAYSFYPNSPDTSIYVTDYFTLVKSLAPDKPLLIPEFGCPSDTGLGFSEELQYQFMRKIVAEVSSTTPSPVAIIWYQMYDTQYLGAPEWFKQFGTIGMRDFAGTPKLVHTAFRKMLDNTGIADYDIKIPKNSVSICPNPFNSTCKIQVIVSAPDVYKVEIYNIAGCLVKNLIDKPMNIGQYVVAWDGRDDKKNFLPSGIYFVKLSRRLSGSASGGKAGDFQETKKMLLIK